jgi:hypothetical protein
VSGTGISESIQPEFYNGTDSVLLFNNWGPYYEKNYRLEFGIASSVEISFVQLEIKDKMENKIFDRTLATTEEVVHYSFICVKWAALKSGWRFMKYASRFSVISYRS